MSVRKKTDDLDPEQPAGCAGCGFILLVTAGICSTAQPPATDAARGCAFIGFVGILIWIGHLIGEHLKRAAPERAARRERLVEAVRQRRAGWELQRHERQRQVRERERERQERQAEHDHASQEREHRRTAIPRLTKWYEEQKAEIERAIPAGTDRETVLLTLWDRYDQLLKELLEEMKP
ncbi:MAG TPA: hypothetical protein VD866_17265 [Urbifossiella sp.]|nr:hypothetical protein [Urbifossiella sp.]